MKTLLCMALFLMLGARAFAGTGWYVTIHNRTAHNVTITPAGNDWWYPDDFAQTQTMGPNESRIFYTETKTSTSGIVGINIDYGYGSVHAEMRFGDHSYSVTKNISSIWILTESWSWVMAYIGTSSYYVTTSILGAWGDVYATLDLYVPAGNAAVYAADDLDGDGDAEHVMISNTTWHVWSNGSGFRPGVSPGSYSSYDLNIPGTPLLGDMDGDGKADPVVVDSSGNWYIWSSTGGYQMSGPYAFDVQGTPLVADFDGDGKADPAVYVHHISGMLWYKWLSGNNYQADSVLAFGEFGAQPVAGDIDGDRKADYATVDESGNWLVMLSSLHYAIAGYYALGVAGKPLLADFDADGKADPVMVSASGEWYVWPSASGYVREGPHVLSVP